MLAFWRFITIVLSALALTMTSAHVLELPQKMTYTAEMYAAVNTTLYRYFALLWKRHHEQSRRCGCSCATDGSTAMQRALSCTSLVSVRS